MTESERFFLMHINSADWVDSYEVVEADTDAAAMVRAKSSLHYDKGTVEVWSRGRLVGRVGRGEGT